MESHAVIRRRHVLAAAAVALGLIVAFVLWWFQPQKLFINHTVNEAAPVTAVGDAPARLVATGRLHSGEHHTTGTVQLLEPGNGRALLRLVDLRTSNGPVVHVLLSATDGNASNGGIDRAAHIDLGGLKGNLGSQNYPVPADVDVSRFHSVIIWCSRFHVAFGAAALAPV